MTKLFRLFRLLALNLVDLYINLVAFFCLRGWIETSDAANHPEPSELLVVPSTWESMLLFLAW